MSDLTPIQIAERVLELDDDYRNPFGGISPERVRQVMKDAQALATAVIEAEAKCRTFDERMQDLRDEHERHLSAVTRTHARVEVERSNYRKAATNNLKDIGQLRKQLTEAQKRIAELESQP